MKRRSHIIIAAMLLSSCGGGYSGPAEQNERPDRTTIEETNRYLIQKDRERIENYVERHSLKMMVSETGLWFMINKQGEGSAIVSDDFVKIEYDMKLLDGTQVYSSAQRGARDIRMGKTSIEPGLDEGLRLLRGGGEALFIIPSYLAHGLIGDGDKIPARAILVCKVRVTEHNGSKYFIN